MARPIEFNKTDAIEAAMEAFWTNGYERTSLQDLIDSMDLSKSSFYNAFGSKHELFADALRSYSALMAADLRRRLDAAGSGKVFIESLLSDIVDTSSDDSALRGCFLMNTATEFAQCDAAINKVTNEGLRQFQNVFRLAVERAIDAGEITGKGNPDRLAWFLLSNVIGLKTMIKAGVNRQALEELRTAILSSFS